MTPVVHIKNPITEKQLTKDHITEITLDTDRYSDSGEVKLVATTMATKNTEVSGGETSHTCNLEQGMHAVRIREQFSKQLPVFIVTLQLIGWHQANQKHTAADLERQTGRCPVCCIYTKNQQGCQNLCIYNKYFTFLFIKSCINRCRSCTK